MDTNLSYESTQYANNGVAFQDDASYETVQGSHDAIRPEYNVTIQANAPYCSNQYNTKKALEDENKNVCTSLEADYVKEVNAVCSA